MIRPPLPPRPSPPKALRTTAENLVKASVQSGSTADDQINRAISSMGRRNGIIWADYSANQTWTTCPNWGTQSTTIVLYPVMYTIAASCTIPSDVSLQFSHGSCLAPATEPRPPSPVTSPRRCPKFSAMPPRATAQSNSPLTQATGPVPGPCVP